MEKIKLPWAIRACVPVPQGTTTCGRARMPTHADGAPQLTTWLAASSLEASLPAVLLPSTADRQPAALSIEDLYGWVCASLGWGTTTLEEQILATGERAAGQERGILATGEQAAGQERGIIHKKEEFEPPPDMPKGTKCTYMDKWLENAFNSMLEKLVEAIMMAPVLTSLPMELWVQVGPVKAAVRNMTLVGLQLGQIRMGAKTGRLAAASLLCLEPSRIFP